MTFLLFLLTSISISLPTAAINKQLRFESITVDDGLSQNNINTILQDSNSFIWFGTYEGLNRYDGYNFKIFRNIPENKNSLSDNDIRVVLQSKSGVFYIGTRNGGLNHYDSIKDIFYRYPIADSRSKRSVNNSISHETVNAICEDASGTIWIGTSFGLNSLDKDSGLITKFFNNPADSNSVVGNKINSIIEDCEQILWIGTDSGLSSYDRRKGVFANYRNIKNDNSSLSNNRINTIFQDVNGNIWIGTADGLNIFDRYDRSFVKYVHNPNNINSISDNMINSIYQDRQYNFWIGTDKGMNIYNPLTKIFQVYSKNTGENYSLNSDQIRVIYEDKSGVLWIGSNFGINKFCRLKNQFDYYISNPKHKNTLLGKDVWAINKDNDYLWIGSRDGGITGINTEGNNYIYYKHNPLNNNSLTSNKVVSIARGPDGNLWAGTREFGLNRINTNSNTVKRYVNSPSDPQSLNGSTVWSIFTDSNNKLWIGTDKGLDLWNPDNDVFQHFTNIEGNPNTICPYDIVQIQEDVSDKNILWLGTLGGGILKFNKSTYTSVQFKNLPDNPQSLSNNRVWSFCQTKNSDIIWIGTLGGGINKFNKKTGFVERFSEKDGLANNVVHSIFRDKKDNLWLSTNKGLSKFNIDKKSFKNYYHEDGIQKGEFNPGSGFLSSSGEIFFGGDEGVTAFIPEKIQDNKSLPVVKITGFRKFETPVKFDTAIEETKNIKLSYNDSFFSFDFIALDFNAPERNQYAYKMEGFDKSWNYSGTRRYVSYSNLKGGEYVFKVKAANNDGLWNEAGTSIHIDIENAPWKTWWAYTLYFIIILSLLYFFLKFIFEMNQRKWSDTLREITNLLNTSLNTEEICERFLEKINSIFNFSLSKILIKHSSDEEFSYIYFQNSKTRNIPNESAIIENVCKNKTPFISRLDKKFSVYKYSNNTDESSFAAAIPMISRNSLLGILIVAHNNSRYFNVTRFNALYSITTQLVSAIENAILFTRVQRLASIDELTGLFNRRQFFELSGRAYNHSKRYSKNLSVCMCDIDFFKQFNDKFGHDVGDIVLKKTAAVIQKSLRDTDILGRYGGEEFSILLVETDYNKALEVCERIRNAVFSMNVSNPNNGELLKVSVSIGMTEVLQEDTSLDSVIKRSDIALYKAKAGGRNIVIGEK